MAVQSIAVPPHNLEAEKSVLGAVLLDERHLYPLLIEEHVRPEHFYREQHGAVFAAMIELHQSDRKIDHLTIADIVNARYWTARGSRVIPLSNVNTFLSAYRGADGVKTGYTRGAGQTLVASATRDGYRLYAVVLNAPDRNNDAAKLLTWAFSSFNWPQ